MRQLELRQRADLDGSHPQQNERQGDLRRQNPAIEQRSSAQGSSRALSRQVAEQIEVPQAPGGTEPAEGPDSGYQNQRERHDPPVEPHVDGEAARRQGDEKREKPPRQNQPESAPERGDQRALGQQLSNDTPWACADHQAHGNLAGAAYRTRGLQPRDVEDGNQQNDS